MPTQSYPPNASEMQQKVVVDAARVEEYEKFRGCDPMQKALADLGLTPDFIAALMLDELGATQVKAQIIEEQEVITPPGGEIPMVITKRSWSYSKPMVDWPTRQAARRDLNKLYGHVPKQAEKGSEEEPLVIKVRQED